MKLIPTFCPLIGILLSSCADYSTSQSTTPPSQKTFQIATTASSKKGTTYGKASWYCIKCNGGTATASGEKLNDYAMTAAHKTLKMGTRVRVTNLVNGKSVIVRINDRGPFIKGRIIDVTKGAAQKLDFINAGVVKCKVQVL